MPYEKIDQIKWDRKCIEKFCKIYLSNEFNRYEHEDDHNGGV